MTTTHKKNEFMKIGDSMLYGEKYETLVILLKRNIQMFPIDQTSVLCEHIQIYI